MSSRSTIAPSPVPAGHEGIETASDNDAVSIRNLRKTFRRTGGATVAAVDGISLSVKKGEMVAIVGPSGCGKTSLLRCVAGLEKPTSGDVHVGGTLVSGSAGNREVFVAPERRGIGMMFQSYALWPHMSVFQNVAYPLQRNRVGRAEISDRVLDVLRRVGLDGLRDESPGQLSGGQQQRVALARSLVAAPAVILFDEPLSNVDAKVREDLRLELVQMHLEFGFAGLYVTHDQDDAMQLCDRLVVLREGEIAQEGSPSSVYEHPNSCYTAEFVGVVNKLSGRRGATRDGHVAVETEIGPVIAATDEYTPEHDLDVAVLSRPHAIEIHRTAPTETVNVWAGTVTARMFMGARVQYLVQVGDTALRVWTQADSFALESNVWVQIRPKDVMVRALEDRTSR